MSILQFALVGDVKRFMSNVKRTAREENKSGFVIFNKFLWCLGRTGCGYSDYINFKLYNRSKAEIDEYITVKIHNEFYEIVSPAAYKEIFAKKPLFLKTFKDFISRDYFVDGTKEELEAFLAKNEVFMAKPHDGYAGHKVQKMKREDITSIDEFYDKLMSERLFLEEYVVQHSEMSRLCPASVNTLRVVTFSYGGKSQILYAVMRVGNGKAEVDNFHQQGMGCLIDTENGVLTGDAVDKDGRMYKEHPLTKVKYDGFKIPNWDKVKKIVLEAALVSDKIHVVGWDVAVTEDGATFIEGNRKPGFGIVQELSNRGRKDLMRICLDTINAAEGTKYKV